MITELKRMRDKYHQMNGQRLLLIEQRDKCIAEKEAAESYYTNALAARTIVQNVAEATQNKLEYHISSLVTAALSAVFPDPYSFELRFVQRRNKIEADLVFIKNGNETDDLLNSAGGGAADIASFALRVALWSIAKTRPVLIMDEAFKFLSVDLQEKASSMLKEISDKLGLQIILVSHLPQIISAADNVIMVENIKGESKVRRN
jgi:DNA repair exonuclease SbcCD ATPase subunit